VPVPYAKLDDPQSLNLYAYVGNNPLSRVDLDGHYLCADGAKCNSANDKAFQSRLNNLKLAQSGLKKGSSGYNRIGKILAYYGGTGDAKTANGKTVSIGFAGKANTGGLTRAVSASTISVNFASNFSQEAKGNSLGATVLVGHEGQHVVDGAPTGTARFGSEFNAEKTSQSILDGINPSIPSFQIRGVTVWRPNGGPLHLSDDAGTAFAVAAKDYKYDLQNDQ